MSKKLIYLISLVLLLGLAVDMANADITTDLVGYWKFDDNDNANDSSGNNYHGEEIGQWICATCTCLYLSGYAGTGAVTPAATTCACTRVTAGASVVRRRGMQMQAPFLLVIGERPRSPIGVEDKFRGDGN